MPKSSASKPNTLRFKRLQMKQHIAALRTSTAFVVLPPARFHTGLPRPPKGSKKWNSPQYEPITTLGKLGAYWGVPFLGSFRGSGLVLQLAHCLSPSTFSLPPSPPPPQLLPPPPTAIAFPKGPRAQIIGSL